MCLTYAPYEDEFKEGCTSVFRKNVPTYFRDHELPEFHGFLDKSQCPYLVIQLNKEIVGCGGFGFGQDPLQADLCWGMIDSDFHQQKLGTFLLLLRLNFIINDSTARFVRLGTSQLTAGFYSRFGFEQIARVPDGFATGLDEVEMRLDVVQHRESLLEQWNRYNPERK